MDMSMIPSPEFLAENNGPTITATASLMIFFCTLFVGLRYYSRYLAGTAFNVEDVLVPLAWVAEIGLCIVGIVMVEKAGTGRHMEYILSTDPGKIPEHFKGIMIQEVLHPAAVAFPKLTVVLLYLHILTQRWERAAAKILAFLIFATWLSFSVAVVFQCMPFDFNWDKTIPNGRCFNVQVFAKSSSVPNIITDLAVLLLPLRTVCCLKISIGKRIGLLFIFLTGSVGIIASIIRTIVFAKTLAEAGPLTDLTWTHVSLINWTMIEPGMYLLSTCALSFKPLFCMFAKALHLNAFITHTKSTFGTKSTSKRTTMERDTGTEVFELGAFRRLSGGSVTGRSEDLKGSKGVEVVVTRKVELGNEARSGFDDWKDQGVDGYFGRAV